VTAAARRWRLDLAYDGGPFHGFAAQPGAETVAGTLAQALARVLRLDAPPLLGCAGRTDAGVHALGQVVHVDLADPLFADDRGDEGVRLRRSLNRQLAPRIVVTRAAPADPSFDARHDATWRSYRYLLYEGEVDSPLLAGRAWQLRGPLDERAMTGAAYALLGTHDFRAFCRRPAGTEPGQAITRRVIDISLEAVPDTLALAEGGRVLRLGITAESFCHQMVRSIAAALAAVGRHELHAAEILDHLRSGERSGMPAPAPPEGLCLLAVGYD
jgi:tRNA pseudouridine38-40 synthase